MLLDIKNMSKQFPGTLALDDVSFTIDQGEIHALCGENGAGKSTTMNIVGGLFEPTTGELFFSGNKVTDFSPENAQKMGVGFVHQELKLCEDLSVAENIFIGRLPSKSGLIDYKKLYEESDEILDRFKVNFDSTMHISELNVSQKQIVEIAKAISLDCKLLILDEPTSSLTQKETDNLFKVMNTLRDEGISMVFISHRMNEVFEICDRVTVLRDGQYVNTFNIDETTEDDVVNSMVGRIIENRYPDKAEEIGEEILKVSHLSDGVKYEGIDFSLYKGEILGFSGLVGSGRTEIMRGLTGIDKITDGEIELFGQSADITSYEDSIDKGIMYLTEDRKDNGLFLEMNIKDNISATNLDQVSNGLFINEKLQNELADTYVDRMNIKISSIESMASSLSGGNQQKVVISKWLSNHPKIFIMDEPTRGIDVGAKAEIHSLIRSLADSGVGVIVISSELPEIMGVSDRIVVIHEGKIAGTIESDEFSEERIMHMASGLMKSKEQVKNGY